jgi:polysaccharide pyruvyl transferase WcaK-like protein
VRLHLGHHFYGAGNLGDDFMLAGFLAAVGRSVPGATLTSCVPFPLEPLRRRFPAVTWLPYDAAIRAQAIAECDAWLGLGGSPFQSALSRWFIDHLVGETAFCGQAGRPMFFLGVGVQTAAELAVPEVQRICAGAAGIWTRDPGSAERIAALPAPPQVRAGADLAHLFFSAVPPPAAAPGRLTLVANFDYGPWDGQIACLQAIRGHPVSERVWLAQESRELPGAERALFAALQAEEKSRWRLVSPEVAGTPVDAVMANWPSGEWLVSARYHAALAGAWAGSRVIIVGTNEKLRAAARDLGAPVIAPDAAEVVVRRALETAAPSAAPQKLAARAQQACEEFFRAVGRMDGCSDGQTVR